MTAAGVIPEVDAWRTAIFTPSADPLPDLAEALFGEAGLGPELRAGEEMEQYQLLQSVWSRWTESPEGYNTAGYQSFLDVDDFEQKL